MFALAAIQSWASWPLSPGEITVGPDRCPPLSNGALQTAQAALRAEEWQTLFLFVLLATTLAALVGVVAAYRFTRRIGQPFVRRWRHFLGWTVLGSVLVALVLLTAVPLGIAGCEAGPASTRLPAAWVALRTLVAALHGAVLYLLISTLLSTVLGRMMKQGRWYDNHRVPLPSQLPRRHG